MDQVARSLSNVRQKLGRNEHFKYPPLRKHPPQIRLIGFGDGDAPDLAKCEISVFDLDNAPPYFGLSYCWGQDQQASALQADSALPPITRNVGDALRLLWYLSHGDSGRWAFQTTDGYELNLQTSAGETVRYFWIDQVCINQGNEQERESQVRQMGDIYNRAEHTLIWLGQYDENVD